MNDLFGSLDVVKLLQVGATGFAVVMLVIAYRLVREVIELKAGDSPAAVETFRQKVRLAYGFLVTSLLLAVLGLTGQVILRSQKLEVLVGVIPAEVPHAKSRVLVLHGVDTVKLEPNGRSLVLVGQRDDVSFDMTAMLAEQQALNTARAQSIVAGSTEGGFDEPK
jgi:hypothetical protein